IPLVVFLPDADSGCEAIATMLGAGLRPSVLDFLDGATLALTQRSYPSDGHGGVPAQAGFALLVEVDGSRADAEAQRAELVELLADAPLALHQPADHDAAEAVSDELYALTAELGGSIAGEHGVGLVKRGRLAAQWGERAISLHEEIKRVFDPKGLLNPGKKLAR